MVHNLRQLAETEGQPEKQKRGLIYRSTIGVTNRKILRITFRNIVREKKSINQLGSLAVPSNKKATTTMATTAASTPSSWRSSCG